MAAPSDDIEDVSMEDEAALLYQAAYAIASDQPDARGGLGPADRGLVPGGFSLDLQRLRDRVRAMGEFGRWRLVLIEAGIRDAKAGRSPRD
jgi:hypothetical protein